MQLYAFAMKNKRDPALVGRLIECRRVLGVSQAKFAEMIGVSQGHYSKIERGEQPISVRKWPRVEQILTENNVASPSLSTQLEVEALDAMRTSVEFRGLVQAALKMHKKE
jgi:transcriptional regulator with XRE-family HTH domain